MAERIESEYETVLGSPLHVFLGFRVEGLGFGVSGHLCRGFCAGAELGLRG